MTALGTSLRILGLGRLIKIVGTMAVTVTYLLLRRTRERQAEDRGGQSKQPKSERSYKYSASPKEKTRVQKVKVESPGQYSSSGQYSSRIIAENLSDLKVSKVQAVSLESSSPGAIGSTRDISSTGDIRSDIESPAHILADIKEPETMQVLDETLSTPIHAEESNQPVDLGANSDEVREKLSAIEAIGCMAAGGNPKAVNLLFKHVQNENFLVRQEAVKGILQYGGREDRELLHKTLPAGDWYIMDIRPADMRKVC